jgi:preprotein translocase SecE subunit
MAKYKPDQGTIARTSAYLMVASLIVFGADTMYLWLRTSFRQADGSPGWPARDLLGSPLPVVSENLTPALIISVVFALAALVGLYRLLNRPKSADLLIDCETEMRKCTWPTLEETWKSSVVVLLVVVFFTVVLAGMDLFLNFVATQYVF